MQSRIWFLFLTVFCSFTHRAEAAGNWIQGSFSDGSLSKTYYTYVPTSLPANQAVPLMVMIHGCTQDATIFAADTGMNKLAEKYGFIVLYPQQDSASNFQKCWNFFDPANQIRGGEPALIVGMVSKLEKSFSIDSNKIYVAGLSSGAAMTAILAACYSDVFSGAAIGSGLEFEAANNSTSAYMAMAMGSSMDPKNSAQDALHCAGSGARAVRIFAIQGSGDTVVSPKNLDQIVSQFVDIDNLLHVGSLAATPIQSSSGQVPGGKSYTVEMYGDENSSAAVEKVVVNGMPHAWSGGGGSGSDQYVDPNGPDASTMLWQFFTNSK